MNRVLAIGVILSGFMTNVNAQSIQITIDAEKNTFPISPYIYGKNNSTSQDSTNPTTATEYTQIRESGATILRENTGNACTKYNWKRKMSSGPDWFNNIFYDNWDAEARGIQKNLPDAQIMYGFQLLGMLPRTANITTMAHHQMEDRIWQGMGLPIPVVLIRKKHLRMVIPRCILKNGLQIHQSKYLTIGLELADLALKKKNSFIGLWIMSLIFGVLLMMMW